jgi:chemotaxis protein CheZ
MATAELQATEATDIRPGILTESDEVVGRIGTLVRTLRESMKALGLDRAVEKAAEVIPDARGRLNYIATMTEDAAERSLNAVDRAQPLQDAMDEESRKLAQQWDRMFDSGSDEEAVKALVLDTRAFLESVPESTAATNKELLEIVMAQDFQDLTGQVIKKLMELVHSVEHQLLDLLVDSHYSEEEREEIRRRIYEKAADGNREEAGNESALLNGPQMDPSGDDVVSSQDQVDDLLDELGF